MSPSVLERRVAEVERLASSLAVEIDPAAVPLCDAGRLHDRVDRAARALGTARTLLAGRVAEGREWKRSGHRSAAEALAARTGVSLAKAKATVATAAVLAANSKLRRAMSTGAISADQGAAIADAARANPSATGGLIELAKKANLQELRQQVGRVKAAADPDPDATYRRLHRDRRLSRFTDSDGSRHLHLQGPVDSVSVIEAELDRRISLLIRSQPAGTAIPQRDAVAFDAAVEMARRSARADTTKPATPPDRTDPGTTDPSTADPGTADSPTNDSPNGSSTNHRPTNDQSDLSNGDRSDLSAGDRSDVSVDDESGPSVPDASPAGGSRRGSQTAPEHLALLRIDIEALWRGHVEGDEICEITGLGPLPVTAARRLLGDAVVKLILTKGEAVAHVTSLTRGPTQAMRYALLWTSPTCTVEGCTRTVIQHDHRYGAEYKDTRHTRLDETDRICNPHHHLRTNHGWALIPGTGKRPIVPPTDPRHPCHAGSGGSTGIGTGGSRASPRSTDTGTGGSRASPTLPGFPSDP